jgi:signal peptidase I
MDIDFSVVLVSLTFAAGVIWAIDRLFLLPGRKQLLEKTMASQAVTAAPTGRSTELQEKILKEPVVVEYAISFFPVLLVVLVLRSFIIEPYQIPSGSMIPTLEIGDFILVNKYSYGIRLPVIGTKVFDMDEPRRGEIMVFIPPHEDRYFIKRVVGTPGDTIRYEDKVIYVNGERQDQKFIARLPVSNPSFMVFEEELGGIKHQIHRDLMKDSSSREWVIPEGYYFMMGDNRDRSSDSRMWGMVPEENIRGKAVAIWMHKPPGLQLPEFNRNGSIN